MILFWPFWNVKTNPEFLGCTYNHIQTNQVTEKKVTVTFTLRKSKVEKDSIGKQLWEKIQTFQIYSFLTMNQPGYEKFSLIFHFFLNDKQSKKGDFSGTTGFWKTKLKISIFLFSPDKFRQIWDHFILSFTILEISLNKCRFTKCNPIYFIHSNRCCWFSLHNNPWTCVLIGSIENQSLS